MTGWAVQSSDNTAWSLRRFHFKEGSTRPSGCELRSRAKPSMYWLSAQRRIEFEEGLRPTMCVISRCENLCRLGTGAGA